ncbi:Uncharacterised protein [Mycobacteroides abscessus subsp. abscessus]|nr:Uncharacterised protein [Mycobacteroides abscessus subsp. abscessus]
MRFSFCFFFGAVRMKGASPLVNLTADQVPLPGSEDTSPTVMESLGSRH